MKKNYRIEFDTHRILVAVQNGNNVALRRAGAYIRKAARNSVSTSDKASAPGLPPHTRAGLLKNSLLFGVEKKQQSVVIGPAESIIGTAMVAHESGETDCIHPCADLEVIPDFASACLRTPLHGSANSGGFYPFHNPLL